MKKLLLPILLIVSTLVFAGPNPTSNLFSAGQQLYVVAESGLNLRSEPTANSPILKKIYYGDMVTVLYTPDSCLVSQEIEWVEGQWIEIDHEGMGGYVFSGYLSPLTIPQSAFDTTEELENLTQTMVSYALANMKSSSSPDSSSNEYSHQVVQSFTKGEQLTQTYFDSGYKVELKLKGVRIMDAYHLLKGMLNTKSDRELLVENSIFIRDNQGKLGMVKVFGEDYIKIKKTNHGDVLISVSATNPIASAQQ